VISPQASGVRLQPPGSGPKVLNRIAATVLAAGLLWHTVGAAQSSSTAALPGLSHRAELIEAYDAILNADFHLAPVRMAPACVDVPVWCEVMDAVSVWWQIALDPETRVHDAHFSRTVERAIASADRWAKQEPARAEAWFAVGAAYGARAQWRVERQQRLAAARDGKRIKQALERALALDPLLHDAHFGIGLYRYYAAVAPVGVRMFRWLLLLPGGDRDAGLQQMLDAYQDGDVIHSEAAYQLHLIYLWYEERPADALTLIRELQQRYPRNPLFVIIEATILDVYFHDVTASAKVLRALIARAESADVNESALAVRRARVLLDALRAPRVY
jgi:tetratricopeptide (TPR) repeat protein